MLIGFKEPAINLVPIVLVPIVSDVGEAMLLSFDMDTKSFKRELSPPNLLNVQGSIVEVHELNGMKKVWEV